MTQVAISVKNVSKKYSIGKQKDSSLRGSLAGLLNKRATKYDEFLALNDVSFDIQRGDVVGIIGKNGAGKSTLLKILSQITRPSAGEIEINGRVASLLEVGTGFHPELTGRENVFLNGTILGMTRKEVASKFDEIVAFSGVEKFIDTPVKHYSSGMYVRLAFAVAAHLEPEILIIDEVLAVGDAEFQKKCLGKMKDVAGEGRTVLFVSHDTAALASLCKTGVLLNKGKVQSQGSMQEVLSAYLNEYRDSYIQFEDDKKPADDYIQLDGVRLVDTNQEQIYDTKIDQEFGVEVRYTILKEGFRPAPNLHFYTASGTYSFVHIFDAKEFEVGSYTAICWIPADLLNNQVYQVGVAFTSLKIQHIHFYAQDLISIEVRESNKERKHEWGGDILGAIRPSFNQSIIKNK